MPEFVLDGMHGQEWDALDEFTQGYIQAAFFTCGNNSGTLPGPNADENGEGDNREVGFADLAPDTLALMVRNCRDFQAAHREDLDEALDNGRINGYTDERAGMDFWYTRNGHGCGYWDRGLGDVGDKLSEACGHRTIWGEVDLYLGDDNKVHQS